MKGLSILLLLGCVGVLGLLLPCRADGEEEAAVAGSAQATTPKLETFGPGLFAVLHTSLGDIIVRLYDERVPKTVANFVGLATGQKEWTDPKTDRRVMRPLYKDVVFHRVIPGFMIQTGDPLGTGTGGPGYKFADEIVRDLKFDCPGRVAMANRGPNTNGSQFFITTHKTPWLDGKYTVFGQVVWGMKTVADISCVPCGEKDRPASPVVLRLVEVKKVELKIAPDETDSEEAQ